MIITLTRHDLNCTQALLAGGPITQQSDVPLLFCILAGVCFVGRTQTRAQPELLYATKT